MLNERATYTVDKKEVIAVISVMNPASWPSDNRALATDSDSSKSISEVGAIRMNTR